MGREKHHFLAAVAGLVLIVGACSSDSATQDRLAELRSQRRALVIQFTSTQNAIRQVQARALDEEGVRLAQEFFNAAFRAAVEREDPEGAELLDRAEALGQDLHLLSTPVILQQGEADPRLSDEERRQVAEELADVERRLRPVVDRAFADPEVQARFRSLQDSVVATMIRLEPTSEVSLDLMRDLEGRIEEIDREIQALEE